MSPLIIVYYFDNYKHIFGTSIIKVMYKKKSWKYNRNVGFCLFVLTCLEICNFFLPFECVGLKAPTLMWFKGQLTP